MRGFAVGHRLLKQEEVFAGTHLGSRQAYGVPYHHSGEYRGGMEFLEAAKLRLSS